MSLGPRVAIVISRELDARFGLVLQFYFEYIFLLFFFERSS